MENQPIIRVTNRTELDAAISYAKGGEKIILADGDYGSLFFMRDKNSAPVEFVSEHAQGARFTSISIRDCSGIHFDGIYAKGFSAEIGNRDIELTNSRIEGTAKFRGVDGLLVQDNDIGGDPGKIVLDANGNLVDAKALPGMGLRLLEVSNFKVIGNDIHHVTEDAFRVVGNSFNGLIDSNVIRDTVAQWPTHPDLFQMFGMYGKSPHDLVISNNYLYDDPKTGSVAAQGMFFTDAQGVGYQNILITQNLVSVTHPNTFVMRMGTENIRIEKNTFFSAADARGGIIRLEGENSGVSVDRNVLKEFYGDLAQVKIGDNFEYSNRMDIGEVFAGNSGNSWEAFLPSARSGAAFSEGYGATDLLARLITASRIADGVTNLPQETTLNPKQIHAFDGLLTMRGSLGVEKIIAHDQLMELAEGTVAATFSVSSTKWERAVISKESGASGDEFAFLYEKGRLQLLIENDGAKTLLDLGEAVVGKTNALQFSFDGSELVAWNNGEEVARIASDFTLEGNTSDLLIGARNKGTVIDSHYSPFHGRISEIDILDQALTPAELAEFEQTGTVVRPAAPSEQGATRDVSDDASADAALLDHMLAYGSDTIDFSNFMFDQNGNVVDVSKKALMIYETPVYKTPGLITMNSSLAGLVEFQYSDATELEEGSMILKFSASTTKYARAVVSKESSALDNDFAVWVEKGQLHMMFEDGHKTVTDSVAITAAQSYDLRISFDGDKVSTWLDKEMVSELDSGFSLDENDETLLIGGRNFTAAPGEVRPSHGMHGRVFEFSIYDETLDDAGELPTQMTDISHLQLSLLPFS